MTRQQIIAKAIEMHQGIAKSNARECVYDAASLERIVDAGLEDGETIPCGKIRFIACLGGHVFADQQGDDDKWTDKPIPADKQEHAQGMALAAKAFNGSQPQPHSMMA